jgi:hypothetical protein
LEDCANAEAESPQQVTNIDPTNQRIMAIVVLAELGR